MLILVASAVALAAGLGVLLVGAMSMGVLARRWRGSRWVRAALFVVAPATLLGAACGAVGLGYVAAQRDEHLIVLGPALGLVIGGLLGLLGGAVAAVWWLRRAPRGR